MLQFEREVDQAITEAIFGVNTRRLALFGGAYRLLDRILAAYARHCSADECWNWINVGEQGYGKIAVPGEIARKAHRVIWKRLKGAIPNGFVVHHICANRRCVNPIHLTLMDSADHCGLSKRGAAECRRGHRYTATSHRLTKHGHRVCRICERQAHKRNNRKYLEAQDTGTDSP